MDLTILNEKSNMHVVHVVYENLISFTLGKNEYMKESGLII